MPALRAYSRPAPQRFALDEGLLGDGGELLRPLEGERKNCAERLESLVFWVCAMLAYLAAAIWVTDELMPNKAQLPRFLTPVDVAQRAAINWLVGIGATLCLLLAAALARRRHCRFWELLFPFLFRRTEQATTLATVSYRARLCMGYLWAFIILASLLSLPFVVYALVTFNERLHHIAVIVSFVFAFLATALSIREVMKHLMNYSSPRLQLHYIRILWMVPIYAITAAATLRFEQKAIFFNAAREAYEAVCVWSFMSLMMEYLKNQAILSSQEQMKRGALHRNDSASVPLNPETVTLVHVHALLEREKSIPHMWGLSRLLPKLGWSDRWKMGEEFLQKCRLGVLQFVPVQMAATLATALCEHQHSYHEGRWSWHSGYAYVTPIRALSQGIALYCLVYFYHGTEELLTEINPLAKFLSIKLVIFFTFWQSVALPLMSEEELPIFGKATLHKFWQYLFTYYYNSYTYSHDTVSDLGDGFDHGNTAVWIMSNHQVWCSCAEAWEFGNFTWFTPGDVSYSPGVVLPTDNPGACCNFLVEPRCGDEPFGRSLWCPVDLSSCTSANGDPVTDHATVHKYMRTVPQDVAHGTAALLANNLTHWSFCTSSFSDFFVMDEDDPNLPEGHNVTFDELCVRGTLAVLVCMEMFLAALAHRQDRFFGYKRFKSQAVMGFSDAFKQMVLSPGDLADDMHEGIQEIGSGVVGATTETLYSGGALAMGGAESLWRAADERFGQLAELGGGSIKNLSGLLTGGANPDQRLAQGSASGRAGGSATEAAT